MATSTTVRSKNASSSATTPVERPRRRPARSGFSRFLKNLLIVLLIIAASVGATLYYSWQQGGITFFAAPNANATEQATEDEEKPATKPAAPAVAPKPIFTSLEPFTVTLNDGQRSRILYTALTLRVEDEETRLLLGEFMPVVRDRVLKTLSAQNPFHVQTPQGREELVNALTMVLNAPYEPSSVKPRIANVLFTAFVVQ
ncbi:flagellar protein FliL [Alcaligenaceae bacterium 429]|nr:flagellar protein FliL [Alcaligenaceae bacterium 429]